MAMAAGQACPSADAVLPSDGELDNHRVAAGKRLFDPEKAIPCRVYRNLNSDAMRIVDDGKPSFASCYT